MSRKFIISEDERARILGLHETAKSNHGTVISEQSIGVGFMSGEPNGLKIEKNENMEQVQPGIAGGAPADKKQIYNDDIAKISQFLPVDTTKFKPIMVIATSPGNDNMQAFKQYQDVIKQVQEILPKFNPNGAKEAATSYYERYTPVTGIPGAVQSYKGTLLSILKDLTNIKMGLNYLASEKAGFPMQKPAWIKNDIQMDQLKGIAKQIGIV